ncbi:MAG TPA: DUF488 domain-containing protein [Acetobacteraceae bacterium]|jgi:uncharacterized protein (DUF488 family)
MKQATQPDILTIGYEGTVIGHVVDALKRAGATHLVDVRAIPQSRKPGFSKNLLAAAMAEAGLRYTHLRSLGTPKPGRDAARKGDLATLHRVFVAHMQTLEAQADLARATAIAAEDRACLLCFERDHTQCHRSIVARLICDATGQDITHLQAEAP